MRCKIGCCAGVQFLFCGMRRFVLMLLMVMLITPCLLSQSRETPYVILISFDGFRYDYAEKFNAPTFKSLSSTGAYAEGLIPTFPSKTFPNHYSIVTGLYPGHHGLVDNNFFDPLRNELYEMKNSNRVRDAYYYGGKPLWKLASDHGLKSASFFWVGSELTDPKLRPEYYYAYDESVPDSIRIQQVISWLSLPERERPHFITLYFSSPDHEGHLFGPSSNETRAAVLNADATLKSLFEKLEKLSLPVNTIIVSDHGMEELQKKPETYIFLDEILDTKDTSLQIANGGTQVHLYLKSQQNIDALYKKINGSDSSYIVFPRQHFPKRWHYDVPRAGDLLLVAQPGYYFIEQARDKFLRNLQPGQYFGVHGYDPKVVKNMQGIFYAVGPNIRARQKIKPFENIHVYPLVAKILGLTTPRIDGDARVLQSIYKPD